MQAPCAACAPTESPFGFSSRGSIRVIINAPISGNDMHNLAAIRGCVHCMILHVRTMYTDIDTDTSAKEPCVDFVSTSVCPSVRPSVHTHATQFHTFRYTD